MERIPLDSGGASRPPAATAAAPRSLELAVRSGLFVSAGAAWWLRRVRFYADPAGRRFRVYAHLDRRDGDPMAAGMNDSAGVELVGEGASMLEALAALADQLVTSPQLDAGGAS